MPASVKKGCMLDGSSRAPANATARDLKTDQSDAAFDAAVATIAKAKEIIDEETKKLTGSAINHSPYDW
ncbi:hypothetical protein LJR234_005761 [Mesorhizobium amorphae]|uniref:hypothetical protein n=1 Tax=Mesorhizobium amorphae TaxID=71433 RepID=UPI003ECD77BB